VGLLWDEFENSPATVLATSVFFHALDGRVPSCNFQNFLSGPRNKKVSKKKILSPARLFPVH
jgi:hypothetical protein